MNMRRLCLILLSLLMTGCAIPGTAEAPCLEQSAAFLTDFEPLWSEWRDKSTLAGSTARIALPNVVSDMQDLRRQVEAVEAPDCALPIKEQAIETMTLNVDAFIAFMGQEETIAGEKLAQATVAGFFVDEYVQELKDGKPLPTVTVEYAIRGDTTTMVRTEFAVHNGRTGTDSTPSQLPYTHEVKLAPGEEASIKATTTTPKDLTCTITVNDRVLVEQSVEQSREIECVAAVP